MTVSLVSGYDVGVSHSAKLMQFLSSLRCSQKAVVSGVQ